MVRFLGAGRETTYGTAVTRTVFFDFFRERITANRNIEIFETARTRYPLYSQVLGYRNEGNIEMPVNIDNVGILLKSLFGSCQTTGSSAPYTHTFTPAETLPSMTLEITHDQISGFARIIDGVVVNKMEFEATANEVLTMSVDIYGRRETIGTPSASPSFPTSKFLMFHKGTIATSDLQGIIKSFRLTLTNNLPADQAYVLMDMYPQSIIRTAQKLEVTGELELLFTSADEYKRFLSGSKTGSTPGDTEGTVAIDLTFQLDSNNSLRFNIPTAVYKSGEVSIDRREIVMLSVEFAGIGDPAITAVLKNSSASIP